MEKFKSQEYLLKILWVIGLTILAVINYNVINQLSLTAQATFNHFLVIWARPILSIIFGLYLSLIFIKKWSININASLLWCVAVPCLLLSFLYPLLVTASTNNPGLFLTSFINFLIYTIYHSNIFGVVAGLTFILSLFAQTKSEVPQK